MQKKTRRKREFPTWDSLVVENMKKDSVFMNLALKRTFREYVQTEDDFFLRETLKQAAAAKGITNLARETGLSRQYIYEMLSEKGNPTLTTFRAVLTALGFKMYVRELKPTKKAKSV
jgi:probable addiction module antidote protein